MKPNEREDLRYSQGAQNPIELEEEIMFSLLPHRDYRGDLLDVGCGIGTIASELIHKGIRVTGIDFSKVAIKKCEKSYVLALHWDVDAKGVPRCHRDPSVLGQWAIIWAGDVIEHLFDPLSFFQKAHDRLRSHGCVILTVPNDFNLRSRLRIGLTGEAIQHRVYKKLRQCKHHTFFSWELLEYMLADSGFVIDKYYSIVRIPGIRGEHQTRSKWLGRLFGRIFIVRARKR